MQHKTETPNTRPVFQASVTREDITEALATYLDNKPTIREQARMCDDRAVELMGAYLGYVQQPNSSAGAWLVYQANLWGFFNS